MNANQRSMSFYSATQSEVHVDYYPFKYDEEDLNLEDFDNFQTEEPNIGSKIDEVFDTYFEDSLFRLLYPQPLKHSPLATKFSAYSKGKKQNYHLPRGFLSYTLFGPRTPGLSLSLLQWQKILNQESLIDAGLYTPADLLVDSSHSHRANRRSVYEAAGHYKELASIRAGTLRSFWRYFSHFTIYFIKGIFAGFGMYTTDRFLLPYLNFK